MAYTQSDLDAVRAAIVALAKGERVRSVSFSSGTTVSFSDADLESLRRLEKEIASELDAQTSGKRSYFVVASRKGF